MILVDVRPIEQGPMPDARSRPLSNAADTELRVVVCEDEEGEEV